MPNVKITVIKKFRSEDVLESNYNLKSIFGKPITKCDLFEERSEFIVDNIERIHEGFCGWTWRDIYKDLSVLFFERNFYRPEKGMAYVSCTDGRKPVVFKLERMEDKPFVC